MFLTRALLVSLSAAAAPAAAQQIASVQLSQSTLSLPVGGRQTVFATAYTTAGSPVTAQFKWISSDERVVMVEVSESESDFAEIVAVGPGSARVTVRAGSRSEAVAVTVTGGATPAVTGTGVAAILNVDPPTIQLLRGETQQLRPVFLRADGQPGSPRPVTWSSLNAGVASVDAATGVVVGISNGQGAVQATAGDLSRVATVEVVDAPFAFSVPVLGISPETEATIAVVVPGQRGRALAPVGLNWKSSNEQVVRVTPLGVARGVGPGSATIIVEGFGQLRELPVRVHRPVAFVDATPAFSRGAIQIPLRGARPFKVVSKAADETEVPDAPVAWTVGDTALAGFDPATGQLTGRALGKTTLLAHPAGPGLDVTWQIDVIAGGVSVVPARAGFGVGDSVPLRASFTTETGEPLGPAQGIQWITENANVTSVDADGRITAVGPGHTRIIARTAWDRADTTEVFVQGALLFASSRSGSADLFSLDPGQPAKDAMQITKDSSNEAMGAWSPDGSRVVFVSDRDGNYELYVADADGGNPSRLTNTPDANELTPTWTPDGRQIVYVVQGSGGRMQIWTMGADGTGARALTTDAQGANLDPAVSPDGRSIAFTTARGGNYDVYLMDPDGANQRAALVSTAKETKPAWFPNGDLAFVQERTERGRPVTVVVRQPVTSGAAPTVISPPDLPVTDFAVSARGDLALEVATPTSDGRFERRLYVLSPGGTPIPLPLASGEQQSGPAFRLPPTR